MAFLELPSELLPKSWHSVHVAAYQNDVGTLERLLERNPDMLTVTDAHSRTSLQIAARSGSTEAALLLVSKGASLKELTDCGENSIDFVQPQWFDFGVRLLRAGTCPSPSFLNVVACNAAFRGDVELLCDVMSFSGSVESVVTVDPLGLSPLHYAAMNGSTECIQVLLSHSTSHDVMRENPSNLCTPLHYACDRGHNEVAQMLLHACRTPQKALSVQNVSYQTPLHLALYGHHWDTVAVLIPHITDFPVLKSKLVDNMGRSISGLLFHLRCEARIIPFDKQIRIPCLTTDEANWLLHISVSDGDRDMVKYAISQGAKLDCYDLTQMVPLTLATRLGDVDMCHLLLDSGASVETPDWSGRTALHYAAAEGHTAIVSLLLAEPATNLSHRSVDGYTALEMALKNAQTGCVSLLVKAAARNKNEEDWQRLLLFAAPIADRALLDDLQEAFFPYDWMERLVSGDAGMKPKLGKPFSGCSLKKITCLRLYRPVQRPPLLFKSHLIKSNVHSVQKHFVKKLEEVHEFIVPSHFMRILKTRRHFLGKIFETRFPLHDILRYGTKAAFSFILDKLADVQQVPQFLRLKDSSGCSLVKLLASVPPKEGLTPEVEQHLESILIEEFALPDGMSFPWAVMHYIISAHVTVLKKKDQLWKEPTPLAAWPNWLRQKKLDTYLSSLLPIRGLDYTNKDDLLLVAEAVLETGEVSLNNQATVPNFINGSHSMQAYLPIFYPALMYSAVSGGATVKLLQMMVNSGGSFAVQLDYTIHRKQSASMFALLEAMKRGHMSVIELCMQHSGFTEFLPVVSPVVLPDVPPDKHVSSSSSRLFLEELGFGLYVLAANGNLDSVMLLFQQMHAVIQEPLLMSGTSVRILYLSLCSVEGEKLGKWMIQGYISVLCNTVLRKGESSSCTSSQNGHNQVFHKLVQVLASGFVKPVWDDDGTLSSFLQLLQYCITHNSYHDRECSMFHILCGWGCTDLVRMVLACPSGLPLITLCDSRGRSPLYYAASGGHLDLVKILLDHGAPLIGKNGFHPLLAALAYLGYGSLVYYFSCSRSPLKRTSINPKYGIKTSAVLSNYTQYFQDLIKEGVVITKSCRPCKLFSDVSQSTELVELVAIPSEDGSCSSHALWYIKLLFILPDMKPVNSLITGQFVCSLASAPNEMLKNLTLDEILALAPASHCHQSPELFRKMLTTFISKLSLKNATMVTCKGYGDLLLNSATELLGMSPTGDSTQYLASWCAALIIFLRDTKIKTVLGIVQTIFPPDDSAIVLSFSEYVNQLLISSVKHQRNDVLLHLLKCNLLPSQVVEAVKCAAENGNSDALRYMLNMPNIQDSLDDFVSNRLIYLAAKKDQKEIIQYLCESEWCEDSVAFWRKVLFASAENGKEKMALEAVTNIPFSQIMSLQNDTDFHELVYHCCWWGMVDLLHCFGIENPRPFQQPYAGVTPLEAAAGNRQINKIAPFICAEMCTMDTFTTYFSSQCCWPDLISNGWLDVICSSRKASGAEREFLSLDPYQRSSLVGNLSAFGAAVHHGVESVVRAFISCWGPFAALAISTIENIPKYSTIKKVCQSRNFPILQLMLKTLFEANLLDELLLPKHIHMVINAGNVDCVRFVLSVAKINWLEYTDPKNEDNILHWLSECHVNVEEIVDLVLSFLDKSNDLPRLAVKTNRCNITALESAISLGNRHLGCQILHHAHNIGEGLVESLFPCIMKAFGWFHLLMQNASTSNCSSTEPHHSTMFSVGSNSDVAKALLCCTYGEWFHSAVILHSVEVLDFVLQNRSKLPCLTDFHLFVCLQQTDVVVKTIRCKMQASVIRFFKEFINYCDKPLHQQIDMEQVFESACLNGAVEVVGFLLDLCKDLDDDTISNGFAEAIAFGNIEAACLLALNSEVPVQNLEKEVKIIRGVNVPPIVNLILFSSQDDIVKALCSPVNGKHWLSLAHIWLMHDWGRYQRDFLRTKLCEAETVIKSHSIRLQCEGSAIQLIIDWDSFKKHIDLETTQKDCPLKLQAMVLSGVFSHMFGNPPVLKFSSLFPDATFNHVTISCVSCSQSPSVSSSWYDGTILISYDPAARVFVFPTIATSPVPSQSPQAPSDLLFTLTVKEKLIMLAKSCTALLRTQVKTRIISFSDEFSKLSHDLYSSLEPVVSVCIKDVVSAIMLSNVPVTLYAEADVLPREFRQIYSHLSSYLLPIQLFSNFHLSSEIVLDESVNVTAVLDSDTLKVSLTFAAQEDEDEVCFTSPSRESILAEIASCLLTAEANVLKQMLSTFFIWSETKFCNGTTKLNCLLSGSDSELCSLSSASQQHLYQLKLLPLIKRFFNCFFSLVNMSGYSLNSSELNLVLLFETFSSSGFDRERNAILISPADMLSHQYQYTSIEIIDSFFAGSRSMLTKPLFAAPIFSMNWEESLEFLYPVVGSKPMHGMLNLSSAIVGKAPSLEVSNVIKTNGERSCEISQSSSPFDSIQLLWLPSKIGQVIFSSSFSDYPLVSSSVKLMVNGNSEWQGKNVVTLDQSLIFVTQHPFGGCVHGRKPARVMLPNRTPIIELDGAVRQEQQDGSLLLALSKEPIHYISALSASQGKIHWIALPCGEVVILTGSKEHHTSDIAGTKVTRMGCGLTRVEVRIAKTGIYFLLAACSHCHAVMKVLWNDHTSLLPEKCTVTPGKLSHHFSYITDQLPRKLDPCSTRTPSSGSCFGPVMATKKFQFFFVARDTYGNLFIDSQRRRIKAKLWSAEKPASPAFSVDCELHPTKVCGVYVSYCKATMVGVHRISVQLNSNQYHVMGGVIISAGPPDASKSQICNILNGILTVTIEEGSTGSCKLILRDQFSNVCKGEAAALQLVTAVVSGSASTPNGGYMCGLVVTQDKANQPMTTITLPRKFLPFLHVRVRGKDVIGSPARLRYKSKATFKQRVTTLQKSLACHGYTPTLTMDRSRLLETAVSLLQPSLFQKTIRVRFGDEHGIDCGGLSSEFFHLLCLEMTNPDYALFECIRDTGLYKPNSNSSVNPNHLFFFEFFGKILAKVIVDGHLITVRMTPAVYKFLKDEPSSLEDLKVENPALFSGLQHVLQCQTQEELDDITANFTTQLESFGAIHTIELIRGGSDKRVTLENKNSFVTTLARFHTTGCIKEQLTCIQKGFHQLINPLQLDIFSSHEVELILCGPSSVPLNELKKKITFLGNNLEMKRWFLEVLDQFSEEDLSRFLLFCTGCATIPSVGSWELQVKLSATDPSHLPTAATCFNVLRLPSYHSKLELSQKLHQAIELGGGFYRH